MCQQRWCLPAAASTLKLEPTKDGAHLSHTFSYYTVPHRVSNFEQTQASKALKLMATVLSLNRRGYDGRMPSEAS